MPPDFSEEEVTAGARAIAQTIGEVRAEVRARAVLVASGAVPGAEHERVARRYEAAVGAARAPVDQEALDAAIEDFERWRTGLREYEADHAAPIRELREENERLRAELERVKAEGTPGVMHKVDQAFYDQTVKQRDLAWRVEERLKAERDQLRAAGRRLSALLAGVARDEQDSVMLDAIEDWAEADAFQAGAERRPQSVDVAEDSGVGGSR